jgi:hypothetical protein
MPFTVIGAYPCWAERKLFSPYGGADLRGGVYSSADALLPTDPSTNEALACTVKFVRPGPFP